MRRVRRIHYLRVLLSPVRIKLYGLAALTTALFSTVSFAHVYANMPSVLAPSAHIHFALSAISHTEFSVQVLLVGVFITLCMLGRDLLRTQHTWRGFVPA